MRTTTRTLAAAAVLTTAVAGFALPASAAHSPAFLHTLNSVRAVGSTVPGNGDVNPYGVAVVRHSAGKLVAGHVLVSNFNAKSNVQGTGTTIVQMAPSGKRTTFAKISSLPKGKRCPGGIGLTTALTILRGGWVVVGSLPTHHGKLPKQNPAGCLIVLNKRGHVVETLTHHQINGPWDMTASSTAHNATLYISNALGGETKTRHGVPVAGQCKIVRIQLALRRAAKPKLTSATTIGTHFPWRANAAALVLAPTGLVIDNGTLYVDDALTNSISAIHKAHSRTTAVTAAATQITQGGSLNAPLGMTQVANGDLIVVNGNNGVATEVTTSGRQRVKRALLKHGAGALFGLAPTPNGKGLYFVDDGTNSLDVARR